MGLLAKLNLVTIVLLVLAVAGGGSAYYYYSQNQKLAKNPNLAAQEESKRIVEAVGKLIDLPKEEPTIATVTDKNKVKDQPFFAKSENGDKVLIFTKAKKAVLYRPSTNKVIEVAPVNIGEGQAQAAATVKVALYNGTKTTGLTTRAETQLKEKVTNIEVVAKENASNDYTETVVIDLTGSNKAVADAVAKELGGTVGSLPSGETKPAGADILVILGSDFE